MRISDWSSDVCSSDLVARPRDASLDLDKGVQLPKPEAANDPADDPGSVAALHELVLQSLDDDQAQETISIPLQGKSRIACYMVIASGRSTRQEIVMAFWR